MRDRRTLIIVPALLVLFHVLFLRGYGWFRDEFYYFACARHLAFGYVDHPALSIVPLWIVRALSGDSLSAARLLAAVASGATVFVVGSMTRDMGGGRFAQILAMVCVAIAPVYLALASFYSMNVFDVLVWVIAGWIVVRLMHAPRLSTWIALGIVLGLGVENKISVLWLIGGLSIGLLLHDYRWLMKPGPWIAAAVAGLLIAPYGIWEIQHGWPTLEFIQRATTDKMVSRSSLSFLGAQIRDMHPLTLPVWLAGLWFFLVDRRGREYRPLGVMFLCVLILLMLNPTSRSGYLSPAYTMLFAGGACWFESALAGFPRAVRPIAIGVLTAGGLITAPLAMPMLPVQTYIQYAAALGGKPSTEEKHELTDLPQFFADRFGWNELVDAATHAYRSLSADEQRVATLYTSNYGEASAIDVLGRATGLPYAVSGHNNYWLWGPGGSGEVLIALTPSRERLESWFGDVQQASTIECNHCMPYENHRPVFVCRRPKQSLAQLWPMLKHFD
jgi:4-amino-4-deoxy-L-arabinose transferase-like glycosyltransferase